MIMDSELMPAMDIQGKDRMYSLVKRVTADSSSTGGWLALGDGGNRYFLKLLDTSDQFYADHVHAMRMILEGHESLVIPIEFIEDRHLVVSPFLEGVNLEQHLSESGPFSIAETLVYLSPIAAVLDHMHFYDVVNRDIKLSNVMLTPQGVRLVDLDLAVHQDVLNSSRAIEDHSFVGTPQFMAPEAARGNEIDYRVDLYALGGVTYQCLTGEVPFSAQSAAASLFQQIKGRIPDITNSMEYAPSGLRSFFYTALAKNREKRFQSGASFMDTLAQFEDPLLLLKKPRLLYNRLMLIFGDIAQDLTVSQGLSYGQFGLPVKQDYLDLINGKASF